MLLLLVCSVCNAGAADPAQRKFVVFFQEWSAAFDDSAREVVSQAADLAKQQPSAMVRVSGFADPTGSRAANVLMSELRSQRVADLLQEDGVAPARIRQRAHGSVQFAGTSQESRRVEITIGGK